MSTSGTFSTEPSPEVPVPTDDRTTGKGGREALAGTVTLVRLGLRRERFTLPAWLLANTAVLAVTAAVHVATLTDDGARTAAAALRSGSAVLRAVNGFPVNDTVGAIIAVDTFFVCSTLATLMAALMVLRQTRLNEETGRGEILAAAPIGRHAGLTAGLLLGVGSCAALFPLLSLALIANGLPPEGSFAAAASVCGVGLVYAGVATVTAQLWRSTRAATYDVILVFGLVFLLRAAGDGFGRVEDDGIGGAGSWPSWYSPMSWAQRIDAFHTNDWRMLLAVAAISLVIVFVGYRFSTRRDVGSNIIDTDSGPDRAPESLRNCAGLIRRLQAKASFWWILSSLLVFSCSGLFTVLYERGVPGADTSLFTVFLREASALPPDTGVVDVLTAVAGSAQGVLALGCPIHALGRLRSEETSGALHVVLSTPVGRIRWLWGHVGFALGSAVVLLLVAGLGFGVSSALAGGQWGDRLGGALVSSAAQLPVLFLFTGLVVLGFGALPRLFTPLLVLMSASCVLLQAGHARVGSSGPVVMAFFIAMGMVMVASGALAFRRRDIAD